ncbi:multidrug effflux MFS transporter [Pseudonocardia spinosispora]|uniref:multidrug effflux MFS transporter n=1 Tax=Pseudonocardia spinosispora TaxID=103441 RepID=UPI00056A9CE8|nr:multidrug effflux MFS transporter [Pseudonocardia spinosispora]
MPHLRLIVTLAALTAVSPFSTDMYVPGFPQIAASFGTSGTAVQLSLTGCLVGVAVGQIVVGPMSDALGRRRPLLVGSALFAVMSLVCALAGSVTVFTLARVLQGAAGSAGIVLARAVISDRFAGPDQARQIGLLSIITSAAPILAPVTGGLVLAIGPWRLVFVALAVAGLLLLAAVWAWVPESLPAHRRRTGGVVAAMGGLLRRPALAGYFLVVACWGGALFAYISGSSFVFQGVYRLSPTGYSLVFATNAVGMLVAGAVFRRLAGRVRLNRLLVTGTSISTAAMIVLAGLLGCGISTLTATWVCLFVMTSGLGMMLPAAVSLILALGDDAPGAASGILGCGLFVFGSAAAPLPGQTALSTAVVVLGFLLAATAALLTLARPWRYLGEPVRA